MSVKPKTPDLVSVTTINRDGSRHFLQPSEVTGRFTTWRRLFGLGLIAIYAVLPWITINGHPAVFLDVATRRFHLFGLTLAAQDLWVLFFLITGLGFTLFVVTALFGRLWCGWACPYTVFQDVFRRVEYWLEGDGPARRKLDDSRWTLNKIARRGSKWLVFLLLATTIAHLFLAYFVSIPELWDMMHRSPLESARSFGVVAFLTVVLYFCFTWFREQFCIIMCPYGRLQSALTDDDTIIIGYDERRGEPRGKKSDPDAGDCIDCRRCVNVCPTGIDIRNGLQLECVGCSACIDACDAIMKKVGRDPGLVRYDSLNGFAGKSKRILRPRVFLYAAVLVAGLALFLVMAFTNARPINAEFTRTRIGNSTYGENERSVINPWKLRLINKRNQPVTFTVTLESAPEGMILTGIDKPIVFEAGKEGDRSFSLMWDKAHYTGPHEVRIHIHAEPGDAHVRETLDFLGPNPALMDKPAPPSNP